MAVKVTKGQICDGCISKICHEEYNLCESFIIVSQSARNAHFSCYAALYKIFQSSLLSVSHFLVYYILVFFYFWLGLMMLDSVS